MRVCSDDRDTVRFAVRAEGLKLRTIVFTRAALRKLAHDPSRAIKVEYLQPRHPAQRRTSCRIPVPAAEQDAPRSGEGRSQQSSLAIASVIQLPDDS